MLGPLLAAVIFVVVGVFSLLVWLLTSRSRSSTWLTIGVFFTFLGALIIWAYSVLLGG